MKTLLYVIDGFGVGECEDSCKYHDEGSNTFKNTLTQVGMQIPNLTTLGLKSIDGLNLDVEGKVLGNYGKMRELSSGKDTTTGHWEISGIISETPFPTFPNGFPKEIVNELEKETGYEFLFNGVGSGTDLIERFGEESLKTKKPILYTSADSVLQIASHIDVIPLEKLYEICEKARKIMKGEFAVGRVIARPFAGEVGKFYRTPDRKDFSLVPPKATLLDKMKNAGFDSVAIGKIEDIFAFQGITESYHTHNNQESLEKSIEIAKRGFNGLMFINLIDTDMLYGHRNDVKGYAGAIERIDLKIPEIINTLENDDLLIITADHGCDPTTPSTDHSREFVPLLVYGKNLKNGVNLGILNGFNSVCVSLLDYYKIEENSNSFLKKLVK